MDVSLFDFDLPEERIALRPAYPRDSARMLVVHEDGSLAHAQVRDLPEFLRAGDLLVANDSRVIAARLRARKGTGGPAIELLLHKRVAPDRFLALARPARKLSAGDELIISDGLIARIVARHDAGEVEIAFDRAGAALDGAIAQYGEMPLPPYIARRRAPDARDASDYQTIFAVHEGSAAAPTAGLHFTPDLLARFAAAGIAREQITLHVGPGTFLPVNAADTSAHLMHGEWVRLTPETAANINRARGAGARIVALGTTSLRTLETAADAKGRLHGFEGETDLFITPGYVFKAVDVLLTNFHLPRSTLFMLVCAFAGIDTMKRAYSESIGQGYRFYSYGDACLFIPGPEMSEFRFELHARCGAARAGVIHTPRGDIATPAFMPVGTAATVKAMLPESVRATGADIVLGNTYHLMLRPGAERVARLGGLHRFMGWERPILTDSGGYQVMSLAKLRKITEEGVAFRSHIDGSEEFLSPERAMQIQRLLGSDIQMVLDECPAFPASEAQIESSLALSLRWAGRSKAAFGGQEGRACFGIAGGTFPQLRRRAAEELIAIGFDGYAVGGLAVGEGQAAMFETLEATVPHLPGEHPRYLMGVGKPSDIAGAVLRGIDMFDCVLPTRSGRNGQAFTREGALNLRNARFAGDSAPLDADCPCPACRNFSRAYLHHVVKAAEIIASMLITWHNLVHYQQLMSALRCAITEGTLPALAARFAASADEDDA